MSHNEVLIQAAKDFHKAILVEIELMMQQKKRLSNPLIDAVCKFESIYWPILPKKDK